MPRNEFLVFFILPVVQQGTPLRSLNIYERSYGRLPISLLSAFRFSPAELCPAMYLPPILRTTRTINNTRNSRILCAMRKMTLVSPLDMQTLVSPTPLYFYAYLYRRIYDISFYTLDMHVLILRHL
ncbi:hypothetical protein C8F04DRAFT_1061732 [Mycena alexandri]|uniref:Uncharacterized protein n=1 Tax=Mycena alexandri TaxID=1745969 RepID=A0AAD6XBZ0_9AGAR|nr:hypothetical protein C8F04DRAFT_1061732 [Mycena alexandri]